jgi:putative transposase
LLTATTAGRRPVFAAFDSGVEVAREIHCLEKGGIWMVHAWVVMPDHFHVLADLRCGTLGTAMRMLKGRTARRINGVCGITGTLWQRGYHDHAIRVEEDLRSIARYVVANPVRAGLVRRLADYPFWGARWI